MSMNIETIAGELERVGYIVLERPLLKKLSKLLFTRCQEVGQQRFHPAKIGSGISRQRSDVIRGDVISWLDDTESTDHAYLAWMEKLRFGLNEALFLGLFDYESHYAIYGAGSGYAKHSDVLSGKKNRLLSTVLYLNEDWKLPDGGELVLFEPNGDTAIATVTPTFGRMIIFLSELLPHQVLVSHTTRRSIAGWFRGREHS